MHRECLATILRTGGPDDARTITTRRFLAGCLSRQQKYAEAESLLREALDAAVKKYGPEHGDTSIRLMCALSDVLAKQRKDSEAEQVARRVLEFQHRQHPRPNLAELDQSSSTLIEVLQRRQAHDDEAAQVEQKLIEFWLAAAHAPDASAATLNSAARRLLYPKIEKLGDAPQALELALRANQRSGQREPNHLRTLAQAYNRTGETAKAIELQKKALSLLAADAPDRAEYEERLVEFERALDPQSGQADP
jgi:tetratricopeptide (TPR) repeat protein